MYKCSKCHQIFDEGTQYDPTAGCIFLGKTEWWVFCVPCAQDIEAMFINTSYLTKD